MSARPKRFLLPQGPEGATEEASRDLPRSESPRWPGRNAPGRTRRRWLAGLTSAVAMSVATASDRGPLPPARELATFQLEEGLRAELVAAEPLVMSPAALAWDESGRLFVAENTGYPTGPGPGHAPAGAVVEVVDTDGDGQADTRRVFAEGLGFPNGLLAWRGGWLVTDAPDLVWLADTDQDGRADRREVWFTGFATNRTTQLRACYPIMGPDGWIYVARGWSGGVLRSPKWPDLPAVDLQGGDFRFRPDGSAAEAIGGNAQFGMVLDDLGRRFLVSNRNPLMHAVVLPRRWRHAPFLPLQEIVEDVAPAGYEARVHPVSADTTTAGYMPELLGQPHAGTFTAACGIHQYFGEGLGTGFQGAWFICEPAQNLVQRQVVVPDGPTFQGHSATGDREFLASTDTWFRPVYAATGPDGALYLADLYRKVIDHPDYLPEAVRGTLDFEAGKDLGRIWRVSGGTAGEGQGRRLDQASVSSLLDALGDGNVWTRQTAHRLLLEHPVTEVFEELTSKVARESAGRVAPETIRTWTNLVRQAEEPRPSPAILGQARRLQLLADLLTRPKGARPEVRGDRTADSRVVAMSFFDPSPTIRETAWRCHLRSIDWARERGGKGGLPDVAYELVDWWAGDPNPAVRFQFALICGETANWTPVVPALVRIARMDAGNRWSRAAVLSGLRGREESFVQALLEGAPMEGPDQGALLAELGRMMGARPDSSVGQLLELLLTEEMGGVEVRVAGLRGLAEGLRQRGVKSLWAWVGGEAIPADRRRNWLRLLEEAGRRAVELAGDRQAAVTARVEAIHFLGEWEGAPGSEPLKAILAADELPDIQVAAAQTLGRFEDPAVGRWLTARGRWSTFSTPVRDAVLASLTSRPAQLPALFDALERGDVPLWVLSPQRRRQLQNHSQPDIRARAKGLFEKATSEDRRKVYEEYRSVLKLPAREADGRAVFLRVCATCHTRAGEGVALGPDLTGVRNQPAEALLLHLIVPNAEIYPGYEAYEVETRDGRVLSGLLSAETPETITLRQAGLEPETLTRTNLVSMTASRLSLMPQELEKTMTRQEMADLLAFLKAAE